VHGWAAGIKSVADAQVVAQLGLEYRFDQSCGCTVIVAGGLGGYGTIAAGEFLSNSKYFREVLSRAPRDWQRESIEAMISTTVIDGNCGASHVVETYSGRYAGRVLGVYCAALFICLCVR